MTSKLIGRLRKIQALAASSNANEADAARRTLFRLIAKHGITDEQIAEAAAEREVYITYKSNFERKLLIQIMAKVRDGKSAPYIYTHRRKRRLYCLATEDEFAEMKTWYAIYKTELAKELELTLSAFIDANHIYDSSSREGELTPEELEELLRIYQRSAGMTPVTVPLSEDRMITA